MEKIKIVVPIYKTELSSREKISLDRLVEVLGHYPIVVIKPRSLDVSALLGMYPTFTTRDFDDGYFRGIEGYNRLMLSRDLYSAFSDTEYILIYQTDAYVFTDRLNQWCDKGYDYVGAPWLKKPAYRWPVISAYRRLQYWWMKSRNKPSKQDLYDKVGNGGFSLRKVASFIRVIESQKDRVTFYATHERFHLFNEDVFWATEPKGFSYPDAIEAISFSFDKYPSFCYRLNGRRLPFGCHGWYKTKNRRFWHKFINF